MCVANQRCSRCRRKTSARHGETGPTPPLLPNSTRKARLFRVQILTEGSNRHRADQQLADVGECLDGEDPSVVPAQAAAERIRIGDVQAWPLVVLVEDLVPAVANLDATPEQDRSEELRLEDVRPHAPEVEEAVAT